MLLPIYCSPHFLLIHLETWHYPLLNWMFLIFCEKNNQINSSTLSLFTNLSLSCVLILQNVYKHLHSYIAHIQHFHIPYISIYHFFLYNDHNEHVFTIYYVLCILIHKTIFYDNQKIFDVILKGCKYDKLSKQLYSLGFFLILQFMKFYKVLSIVSQILKIQVLVNSWHILEVKSNLLIWIKKLNYLHY